MNGWMWCEGGRLQSAPGVGGGFGFIGQLNWVEEGRVNTATPWSVFGL